MMKTLKVRIPSLALVLTLLCASVLPVLSLGSIQAYDSDYTIYVHPDGSIHPFDAPISKVGNTYTLTDDIVSQSNGIIFMANDSILDGGGHRLGSEYFYSSNGLTLDGVNDVEVRNLLVENFTAGLTATDSSSLWVHDSTFINNTIQIAGTCADLNVSYNTFRGFGGMTFGGVTDGVEVHGNDIDIYNVGVFFNNSANVRISGNRILSGGDGITFGKSEHALIDNNEILRATYLDGIRFESSVDCEIRSNFIANCAFGYAIYVAGSCSDTRILDNKFQNNNGAVGLAASSHTNITGNEVLNGTRGIELFSTSSDSLIWNNTFSNMSKGGNAIGLFDPYPYVGPHSGVVILGNSVEGAGGGIAVQNSTDALVSENRLRDIGNGIHFSSAENCTLTNNSVVNVGYMGISFYGATRAAWISDNFVSGFSGSGIHMESSTGSTILRNRILHGSEGVVLWSTGMTLYNSTADSILGNEIGMMTDVGIHLEKSNHTLVRNNHIHNVDGVGLVYGDTTGNATAMNNTFASNGYGIACYQKPVAVLGNHIVGNLNDGITANSPKGLVIRGNEISGNGNGVALNWASGARLIGNDILSNRDNGIMLSVSPSNQLVDNRIKYNGRAGVNVTVSDSNLLYGNEIDSNHGFDLYLDWSRNNLIYHNALNGSDDIFTTGTFVNLWDFGYPIGGNLWSAYQGNDSFQGIGQNLNGSDGIYDEPYILNAENTDRYPLVRLEAQVQYGIDPIMGGNMGPVTVRVYGMGESNITRAALLRHGLPSISADHVFTINGIVYATFDLRGKEPGVCDLVLRNGSTNTTLPSAFTIVSGGSYKLEIDFIGRDTIRKGSNNSYFVRVSNVGLVDSGWKMLRLMAGYPTQIYKITAILEGASPLVGNDVVDWGVVRTTVFDKDEPLPLGQEDFLGLQDLVIWNVPAGGSLLYEVQIHCDRNDTDPLIMLLGVPFVVGYLADYMMNVVTSIEAYGPAVDPYKGYTFNDFTNVAYDALEKTASEYFLGGSIESGAGPRIDSAIGLADLSLDLLERAKYIKIPGPMSTILKAYKVAKFIYDTADALDTSYDRWKRHYEEEGVEVEVIRVIPVRSCDPNEMVGPQGFGPPGYIPSTSRFDYSIFFENLANATASAEKVVVTCPLDPDLDWSTLMIGPMSHTENATVNFNSVTGVITWTFENINLPPNQAPPEGEGYVTFSVEPKPGLPSGTEITEGASIVFDYNDPLATNNHTNTLDLVLPSSSVAAMSPSQQNNFTVSWTGSDGGGSGVGFFNIFVSEDGGPYLLWKNMTNATSAIFDGTVGHSYSFYSVSYDNVGNKEAAPAGPDLTVTVVPPPLPLQVSVSCDPASITSGGQVALDINVTCQGVGVVGALVTLSCPDGGNVSSVVDLGGGKYSAVFTSPNAKTQVTCSIDVSVGKSGYLSNASSADVVVGPVTVPAAGSSGLSLELLMIIAAAAAILVGAVIFAVLRKRKQERPKQ
jgi:parallel beta-helix repeat protein